MATYNCNTKSTLSTYNAAQTVAQGDLLSFATNYISTGVGISHTPGSSTINLTRRGLYLVEFSGTTTLGATAGAVTVQLYRNGVAVPSGIATRTPTDATDIENFKFSTMIQVGSTCPNSGIGLTTIPLTFVNTGVEATYNIASVTIVKVQ